MWWPKLENKVNEILQIQVAGGSNNVRSDRDLIEEILELSRVNSKRMLRRGGFSRHTVHRLVDTLQEIQFRLIKNGDMESLMLWQELRIPIKEMCFELDLPEVYDRFRVNGKHMLMELDSIRGIGKVNLNDSQKE